MVTADSGAQRPPVETGVAAPRQGAGEGAGPPPVVVVSDDRATRETVAASLERMGYPVAAYPRGAQAVAAAQALPPELVVLELELPDAEGLELCRRLRAIDGLAALPAVFLGDDDDTQGRSRVFAVPDVDYLPRPFSERELLMRVRSHVELHRIRQWLAARGLDLGEVVEATRAQLPPTREREPGGDARLAMLFSTLPDMAFLKDPDGRYLAVNPRVEELLGKPAETIVGRPDEVVFPSELAGRLRDDDRAAVDRGGPGVTEEWMTYPDGHEVLLETIKTPMYDLDGSLLGVLGIARDITEREESRRRLARSEAALARAQQVAGVGSWSLDLVTGDLEPSAQILRMFGLPEGSQPTKEDFLELVHPDDRWWVLPEWDRSVRDGRLAIEHRIVVGGRTRWLRVRAEFEREDGVAVRFVGTVLDITQDKENEARLAAETAQLEDTLEAAEAGGWRWHVPSDDVDVDERWQAMIADLGGRDVPITATEWLSWIHPDDAPDVRRALARLLDGQTSRYEAAYRIRNAEGRWAAVRDRGRVMAWTASGAPEVVRGMVLDTSTGQTRPEALDYLTQHDGLTGLANRERFASRLRERMAEDRDARGLALAILDLDGFHGINEAHGRGVGNEVLVEVARRLVAFVGDPEDATRLGGDEFGLVFDGTCASGDLDDCAQRLGAAVAEPIVTSVGTLVASASIGVTLYPQPREVEPEQLLRQADQAVYHAKIAGKDRYHVFDLDHHEHSRTRYGRLDDVRRGLEAGEFVLHYQPQVDLATGALLGFEALARWQHPDRGLLGPGEFIPFLEGDPLAIDFGDWVIGAALDQLATWNAAGFDTVVSVNVDSTQLHHPGFLERLRRHLDARPDVDAAQLAIEILETGVLEDLEHVADLVARLSRLGVATALDDFGTGYSSLTLLKRLRADFIKIDRSFVLDLLTDPEHAVIVNSIVGLAESFGCTVVAEGLETDIHGELLRELGCTAAQGFGIARPMPPDAVDDWLASWRPPPSWSAVGRVDPAGMAGLYAEFEHRAWLHALTEVLAGVEPARPSVPEQECGLSRWLADAEQELAAIAEDHHAVHKAGCDALAADDDAERAALLEALRSHSEQMLTALRAWRRQSPGSDPA